MGLFTVPVAYQGTYWEALVLLLQTDCPFVEIETGEFVLYQCTYAQWAKHLPLHLAVEEWGGDCESMGCFKECRLAQALLTNRVTPGVRQVHVFALTCVHHHLVRQGFITKVEGTHGHWEVKP